MRGPITWRNVDAPDFSRGNLISSGVADIQSGLEGLQNILSTQARQQQQTWQQGKEANTLNTLNQINHINSVDALNNTQASDLINPYGAQVDAKAVMDALKGQRGVIAKDMQTEDAINGYTEKAKYGPIADQAALLIQQGRTQEAAPLLEQLKGTSYAEKLGGMVQQLDWHNQDQRLKQRELDIQAARFDQEKSAKNAIDTQEAATSNAAREIGILVSSGKATPSEATALMIQKYGQVPGVDPVKLTERLQSYNNSFKLSDANQDVVKQFNVAWEDSDTKVGRVVQQAKDTIAQKVGYNPAMDEQIAQAGKMNKEVLIGDKSGQITKATLDDLDKQMRDAKQPPLTTGEIAYVIQNRDKALIPGMDDTYSVADILQQREAKTNYDQQVRGVNDLYDKWKRGSADSRKKYIVDYTKESLAPSMYDPTASAGKLDTGLQELGKQYTAFEQSLGPIVNITDKTAKLEQQNKDLEEQQKVLLDHQKKINKQNEALQANTVTREKIIDMQVERRKEEAAMENFVTNYKPKTNEEWDTVMGVLGTDIQQNDPYPTMKLKALTEAVAKAKNGDDKDFRVYFKDRLEKYAATLYPGQKAGKK